MSQDTSSESHSLHLLNPPLPFDMKLRMQQTTENDGSVQRIQNTARTKFAQREKSYTEAFGDRQTDVKTLAGQIKQHTLDHLDQYLEQFIQSATKSGMKVHLARDAAQARKICLNIAQSHGCKCCIKSKSMVTEEIQLLSALESGGIETYETDLGEFIVQLDGDAPSHIVTPVIHKDRESIARTFRQKLGAETTSDPEDLTEVARQYLRNVYRKADLGISGANFLVADTGTIVLCTNEGNGRFVTEVPPVHIVVAGIEKVIPRINDLSLLLKLLARSSTGQPLTVYTSLINGPTQHGDPVSTHEINVILLDNGRSNLLPAPTRSLLRCIRCGACLNACPVFRHAGGGHAYGSVYSGPIGSAITPLMRGVSNYSDLPKASSLCGSCHQVCPVNINLPQQLINLRQEAVTQQIPSRLESLIYRLFALCLRYPFLYRATSYFNKLFTRLGGISTGAHDQFSNRKWVKHAPWLFRHWTTCRDLPTPTSKNFQHWWILRNRGSSS